jgi:murein DD-endopeptidase MepM/ murein hydrolase activator NlpD
MLARRQFALQIGGRLQAGEPGSASFGVAMGPIRVNKRALALACAVALACGLAGTATGQDLQSRLENKKNHLNDVREHEKVLSSTIQKYGDRIDELIGQISVLSNRVAVVQDELDQKQAELHRNRVRLDQLRSNLRRSLNVLRNRLIGIYRAGQPDLLTVVLNSDGYSDLVERYEYLKRIEQNDSSVVDRVRDLRNDTIVTVNRVTAERNEIADRKAELERTQAELQARQDELDAARANRQAALDNAKGTEHELEGDVSKIQDRIQAQIAAAQQSSSVPAAPAGPFQGESSQGFIWPVNGPITSPFCETRAWEACHPGIDIGVPAGTPIHAVANGVVLFTQSESESGGYGNYTCIDHGSGISSCYAHQSSFGVSQGQQVAQGDVIGSVGCTGLCFGDHLHFEVRINGQVTDPMAYLP